MTEKDFTLVITKYESSNKNKVQLAQITDNFINNLSKYLLKDITIKEVINTNWHLLGIIDEIDSINICLDVDVLNINTNKDQLIFNSIENACILLNASKIERTNSSIKCIIEDREYNIILKRNTINQVEYYKLFQKKYKELNNEYTLLKNTMILVKDIINEEKIKDIDPLLLVEILSNTLKKEVKENKYYKYLTHLYKSIDELTNNKKYTINSIIDDTPYSYELSEAKLSEYRKLRKSIVKKVTNEQETIKFNSQTEVVIDVNPIFNDTNKTFMWHYNIVGKNLENQGGIYQNTESEYQTAILKGLFKGLKVIIDLNLVKKDIIIKCNYSGILTPIMLTSDENKSRMKTIKSLIENYNLKIKSN